MQTVKKYTASDFRISASQITKIMGKLSGFTDSDRAKLLELEEKSKSNPLTEKMLEDYDKQMNILNLYTREEISEGEKRPTEKQFKSASEKIDKYEERKKQDVLTVKQREELNALTLKKDAPLELPQGAKTYVEKWVKDFIIYRRKRLIGSKYTKKGNENEDESIDLICDYFNLGFISKNKIRKFAEFIEGECDIELAKCTIDAKNSYTHDTFPVFEKDLPNYDYYGQAQGYMELYDKEYALVAFVLTTASEDIIEREAKNQAWLLGLPEVTFDLYESVRLSMTYDDLDIRTRIKVFRIERNREYIEAVNKRVILCREYAQRLIDEFKENVKSQINLIKP